MSLRKMGFSYINRGHQTRSRERSEEVAAVGEPPACEADGDGGEEGPPEREHEVGEHAQERERQPEDFALHVLKTLGGAISSKGNAGRE